MSNQKSKGEVEIIKRDFIKFLNNEFLFSFCKCFGMYLQIQWWVTDVDAETLTVHIEISWRLADRGYQSIDPIVFNVRNALLNAFRDLLPCPVIKINPTLLFVIIFSFGLFLRRIFKEFI